MQHISVIGSGTMGNGIAHVFAQNGFPVDLVDTNAGQLDKAMQTIARTWTARSQKARSPRRRRRLPLAVYIAIPIWPRVLSGQASSWKRPRKIST
jgi:3-hydroxybutyryl-CoA dehydrogenase